MHWVVSLKLRLFAFFIVTGTVLLLSIYASPAATSESSLRDRMIKKAKEEGVLLVSGSQANEFRTEIKGFKKRYPFIDVKAFDANTANTANRVFIEARARKLTIDIVAITAEGNELLARRGVLKRYEFPHLKDFIPGSQPAHGLYVAGILTARPQGVYNTDLVPPDMAPRTWDDMVNPKWSGQTLISRSSEEFPAVLAWLWRKDGKLNWKRSMTFFEKLIKNHNPGIARGYSGGVNRVATGEKNIFWFAPLGTFYRLSSKGAPLGLIAFPKFPATYRTWGIPKDAPHPAAAWLFVDYLTSPEGQFEYTDVIQGAFVLNKKAEPGKLLKQVTKLGATFENADPIDPVTQTSVFTDEVLRKSEKFFFKLLGIR